MTKVESMKPIRAPLVSRRMQMALSIAAGGAIGSVLRWYAGQWTSTSVPWGTWAVNILGSLLLGLVVGAYASRTIDPAWVNGVTVGLLGGFTTFSTFTLQSVELWESGRPQWAAINIFVSVLAGLTAAVVGLAAGRAM